MHVRDDGFEYDGQLYRSLNAVAKAIIGGLVGRLKPAQTDVTLVLR